MVAPIKAITHAMSNPLDTISSVLGRAFTPPGGPGIPDPSLPAPSTSPTAKPARKGMQQSFLSGVAGSTAQAAGSAAVGKTLLGQ